MGYSKTIMGGSSSPKLVMETRMEKLYYRRTSITYDKATHANYSSSPNEIIHIFPSSTTTTCTTHP